MQGKAVQILVFAFAALIGASADQVSPIEKVLEMISSLESKVIGEGEGSQKVYEEFSEWCEEESKGLQYSIKTGKAEVEDLKAVISEEEAVVDSLTTKVDEVSGEVATDEADLKAATEIRDKEAADFAAEEKECTEIISTLQRAISILEKEMAKGSASMLQLQGLKNVAQALDVMVQASVFDSADASRLTALVQQDDGDDDSGAPDAAVYEEHSSGIVETMEGLLTKAQDQLDAARKKEQKNLYNYQLLKQSLEDQISTATKEMDKAKKSIAASSEKKATAEGDLTATTKDLQADINTLGDVHHECMTGAAEFEAETSSRAEELKALAQAKKIIKEATSFAQSQVSFMQLGQSGSVNFQAVRFVRELARKQHAPALTQLAAKMASAIRSANRMNSDPFAKVEGLIKDMIARLEAESEADATHKAYCDKEIAETKVKQEDKTAEIESLTTAIDEMTAKSSKLKEEVATLQKELADLAASQAEMDKIRKEENELYVASKAENEKGLKGIQLALKVLRDYYGKDDKAHASNEGAGDGIISLLEVVESDFTKALAEEAGAEESAQSEYVATTKANEIEQVSKTQDVKYKTQESTDLDKTVSETSADLANVQAEIAAVNEYMTKLEDECVEKAEPYEERVRRRNAELEGLKQALDILSGEAVLLQRGSSEKRLRGVRKHVA